MLRWFWRCLRLLVLLPVCTVPVSAEFNDYRALWVTRFDYASTNAATVNAIVDNAARLGITDLMFQVRGRADALYNSSFEPRAENMNPGWDPLQTAIDRAQGHGIKLHAWINTMPLWQGTTPPQDVAHPFYETDPSYRIYDAFGNPQPLGSSYVTANPVSQAWHDHVTNVAGDIVSNYDVDGLHMDYIRWVGSTAWSDLPQDPESLQAFTNATGLPAASTHAESYRDFIRGRIGDLVESVSQTARGLDPGIDVSAAVWRDPDVGRSQVLQDYRVWLEEDYLDTVMPMIYLSESNNHLLQPNLSNILAIDTEARVAPGLGVYLHSDPDFTLSQLNTLYQNGTDGATLYAYSEFFRSGALGVERFGKVRDFLDTVGREIIPITDFEVGEGYFENSPTQSGSNSGVFAATANRTVATAQEGTASQELIVNGDSGGWFLRHLAGIDYRGDVASTEGNLPLAADGYLGVWLKTATSGLEVSLALDDPATADRGIRRSLIADDQWHLYEWNLDDDAMWESWVGGNGVIDGSLVTLDSLQFWGAGDATIFIDSISHNPNGSIGGLLFPGDFNGDQRYTVEDMDILVGEIASGMVNLDFDIDGDGRLDVDDRDLWLQIAGEANLGPGLEYLVGDANLDGVVDGLDFVAWNAHKFTETAAWSGGDFDVNGVVDGTDFIWWNFFKFESSFATPAVPEPSSGGWFALLVTAVFVCRLRG